MIEHLITLDMDDILEMVREKIGVEGTLNSEKITITDYEAPQDTEGVGEKKAAKTSELVKKSNIVKALKEGLAAANASNIFPKNAKKICEDAMNVTLEELSKKDADLFMRIINTAGFTNFALLWQKYQNQIQKSL